MLLAATLTQKLPGSRISCQSTRPITTDESSSSAQVTDKFILQFFPFPLDPGFYFHLKVFPSTLLWPSFNIHSVLSPFCPLPPPPNPFFLYFCSYKASVILALVHPFLISVPHSSCRGYWLCFSNAPLCCCCGMSWLWMVANPSKLFKAFKSELSTSQLSPLFSETLRGLPVQITIMRALISPLLKKHYKIFVTTRFRALFVYSCVNKCFCWQHLKGKPRWWWHALREWPL